MHDSKVQSEQNCVNHEKLYADVRKGLDVNPREVIST